MALYDGEDNAFVRQTNSEKEEAIFALIQYTSLLGVPVLFDSFDRLFSPSGTSSGLDKGTYGFAVRSYYGTCMNENTKM